MVKKRIANGTLTAGFSQTAWLAIIAGIVILVICAKPYIEQKYNATRNLRAMQNAQLIATVAANAQAAGNISIGHADGLSSALDQMRDGVTGEGGLVTMTFSIDNMDQIQINEAKIYLEWRGGTISYIGPSGR